MNAKRVEPGDVAVDPTDRTVRGRVREVVRVPSREGVGAREEIYVEWMPHLGRTDA